MTVDHIDLNLIRVLDALLQDGSVSGAARRLHLSAPAVSRSLGRLRRVLHDPLFVRAGRHLVPTPRAEALRADVNGVMAQIASLVAPPDTIDPATLTQRFTIRADDVVITVLALPLLSAVHATAPGVDIEFLPEVRDPFLELRNGEVDVAIGVYTDIDPDVMHTELLTDRFVATVRRGHPLTATRLTPKRYADAHHLNVSPRARRVGPIDEALATLGLERRRTTTVPSFLVAAHLVATTDMVGNLPRTLAVALADLLHIEAMEVPVAVSNFTLSQHWHQRHTNDVAHAWLRATIADTASVILPHASTR